MPTDPPLAVTLVIAPKFSYLSLAILMDGLRIANRLSLSTAFDWIVADVTGRPVASSSGLTARPQARLADIAFTPVAIVLTAYEPEAACTPDLLNWLRRQDRRGATLGCVDTGALILARAGLVDGAQIAVHPEVVRPFREEIGDAVLLDRRSAFHGRRLSSAGGFATMDMLMALIERARGPRLASQVAQAMLFETASSPFTRAEDPAGGVASIDPRLGRLIALMQDHIEEPLAVEELCAIARVDPSTARRLFRRQVGDSPVAYYRRLRLERARTLLRYSHLAVGEIALATGFSDIASFSHAFKRLFGRPPSKAREDATGL